MTLEAPVHRACADHSLAVCPHLRQRGFEPTPFPGGASVLAATIKRESLSELFGLHAASDQIIGQLKLAWPESRIRIRPQAAG